MRKFIIIILSLILTSCANYSKYNPTDDPLPVPEKWNANDEHYKNGEENLVCLPWWKQFKDSSLDAFIDRGLLYNNDIHVAMANVEAAQGELLRVKLNWVPEIGFGGGYSSFPDLGYPGVILSVLPSYTLNIFKQIKDHKRADYELKATQAMHDGVRLAVIGQIAGSYFNYVGQTEQLEILQSLDKDLSKLIQIAENLDKTGLNTSIEVEEAKRDLYEIKTRETVVKQNIVVSQNAIHFLLNEHPGILSSAKKFNKLSGQHMIIGALPFDVINNRPDMQQATQELAAANEGIGIAFSQLLPTLEFRIARGEIATKPNGTTLGQNLYFNEGLFEIPILKASIFGELATKKGLNKASYYQYSNTLLRVLRDVNNDLSAHDLYTKRLEDITHAEKREKKFFSLNTGLYQRGIISYQNLIEKRIELNNIALQVSQNKLDQFITIVNLYQNLAVGYNYHPAEEKP